MTTTLHDVLLPALHRTSPRYTQEPLSWRSVGIHAAGVLLWAGLLWSSLQQQSIGSWAIGIAYVSYDTALLLFVAWHTRHLGGLGTAPSPKPDAKHSQTEHTKPSVGVIVAAHNEAAVLPITLQALLMQTDAIDQIVIADDGSSDGTDALLTQRYGLTPPSLGQLSTQSQTHPRLFWLRLPHGGKARALNTALQIIRTDTVMTVDGDTLLDPGAVAAVREAFSREPELVAVTGVITPVCNDTLSGRTLQWFQTYEYIRNFLSRHAWMQRDSLLLVSGAFATFRRKAVLTVGGFDPDCLVEDYELIHRLHRHARNHGLDWRVRVLGMAQARTEAPSDAMAFLRQRRRWFGGFLQTQFWYQGMVGNKAYGDLGTKMLVVKAIDTLQPLYGLTAFILLLGYAGTGRLALAGAALSVIGTKLVVDLAFHLWSIRLYRRWVGDSGRASVVHAIAAALAEPFTFQLLRHLAAAWGWWSVLSGQFQWGKQVRTGLASNRVQDSGASS
jgi:cellulose synthase/poly-beta-1,6-N-acetylglucosamine synthase-like glycosyltransferase